MSLYSDKSSLCDAAVTDYGDCDATLWSPRVRWGDDCPELLEISLLLLGGRHNKHAATVSTTAAATATTTIATATTFLQQRKIHPESELRPRVLRQHG